MKKFRSNSRNAHGVKWILEFDYDKKYSFITGDDSDYQKIPVYDGIALDLILDNQELDWLKKVWKDATKGIDNVLYLGKDTKLIVNNKYCELTNNYCPICLKQKQEYEIHHCIPAFDGGTDDYYNLLKICSTCHAIIARGSVEDRNPMLFSALFHQMMYFGIELIPTEGRKKGRHKGRNFLEEFPSARKVVDYFYKLSSDKQKICDDTLKNIGKYCYQYFRDMSRGIWSWKAFQKEIDFFQTKIT
jgi:hypothetical protein